MPYFSVAIALKSLNVEPGAYGLSARSISGSAPFGIEVVGRQSAGDDHVRVERGCRRQCHHRAGTGVEHRDRATGGLVVTAVVGIDQVARAVHALRERILGHLLRVDVDVELHVVAGLRLADDRLADLDPAVVDAHLLQLRLPAELGFERLLDAALSDRVVELVALRLVRRVLLGVDLPVYPSTWAASVPCG